MTKAFIAEVIKTSTGITDAAANRAAGSVVEAIIEKLTTHGKFTLSNFGTFAIRETKSKNAVNPKTGAAIQVKAGRKIAFKAAPTLREMV